MSAWQTFPDKKFKVRLLTVFMLCMAWFTVCTNNSVRFLTYYTFSQTLLFTYLHKKMDAAKKTVQLTHHVTLSCALKFMCFCCCENTYQLPARAKILNWFQHVYIC